MSNKKGYFQVPIRKIANKKPAHTMGQLDLFERKPVTEIRVFLMSNL